MGDALTVSSMRVNGCRIVFVGGELDVATVPKLAGVLADLDEANLILDLWDLSFVDSTGVRLLVEAHGRLEREGRQLTLRWARGVPWRAIQMLGLDTVLHLDQSASRAPGAPVA
jgi:anti-sigma B factor antagonist